MAIATIVILAMGMAVLMFFSSDWSPAVLQGISLREITYSFCVLSLLLVAYLVERQLTVRRLRKQLLEERLRTSRLLGRASDDLLEILPDVERFRTRLKVEFSSAVTFQQPLSLVLIVLRPSRQVIESGETSTVIAEAVKASIRKLRGEDTVYMLGHGVFGILQPGTLEEDADQVAARLRERLLDASSSKSRFEFDVHVINYPRQVGSMNEIIEFIESVGAPASKSLQSENPAS
jgi:GGDEF domain-containing protein